MNEDIVRGIDKLRQFGLRMILSHQNLSQLREAGERVYGAVNAAGVKVYFGVEMEDAEIVAPKAFAKRIDLQEEKEKFQTPAVVAN